MDIQSPIPRHGRAARATFMCTTRGVAGDLPHKTAKQNECEPAESCDPGTVQKKFGMEKTRRGQLLPAARFTLALASITASLALLTADFAAAAGLGHPGTPFLFALFHFPIHST